MHSHELAEAFYCGIEYRCEALHKAKVQPFFSLDKVPKFRRMLYERVYSLWSVIRHAETLMFFGSSDDTLQHAGAFQLWVGGKWSPTNLKREKGRDHTDRGPLELLNLRNWRA
jgi:hypothetical protein